MPRPLIAYDASSVPARPAGAGVYTLQLIRALGGVAPDYDFVIYARRHALGFLSELPSNCTLVDIGEKSRTSRLLWEQMLLPIDLRRRGAKLLHSPHHTTPLFYAPCPRVLTVHDVTFFILPERYPMARRIYFQTLTIQSARKAKAVIVPSLSVRDESIGYLGVGAARITPIHEGHDAAFRPLERDGCALVARERYGLPEGYLLSLGTREPGKNREAILWAMRYLVDLGVDAHLAIVGQEAWGAGEEAATVERLELASRVHFTGYVPQEDLPALYNAASVFVFPSLYEGFGLPVIEAMACGTPVITSNVSALPEIAGDAAVLVDPRDAHALADAIGAVLADEGEASRLRQVGIERARAFTWEACARETLAVYERVLAGTP